MPKIIVFGEDWGKHPSSTQHLFKWLSQDNEVVWVNSIGLRRPRLSLNDCRRLFKKLMAFFKSNKSHVIDKAPFEVVNPMVIPLPGSHIARWVNGYLLKWQLMKYVQQESEVVLWTSLPSAVDVLGKLGENVVVYYCGDDFNGLAGVDHQAVSLMEGDLVKKSDLVMVASENLQRKFSCHTALVPHGVDVSLFSSQKTRPKDLPVGKPVAGFYGAFAAWLDVDMLVQLAQRCNDWNFVFIGPVLIDNSRLKTLKNVFFLGEKSHENLVGYVQHWQISMLPFRDCDQIRACNPLKLREYLCTGTPVVSAPFPALEEYKQHIYVAKGAEHFENALRTSLERQLTPALHVKFQAEAENRRAAVKNQSWENRASFVQALISQCLQQKSMCKLTMQNANDTRV